MVRWNGTAGAEWVRRPKLAASAPARAYDAMFVGPIPPDTSTSTAVPPGRRRISRTIRPTVRGDWLSIRRRRAPAARASRACGRERTSTWTRSGRRTRARARRTARSSGTSDRWLLLTNTASERSRRWGSPPPCTTAAFSKSRRPGRVFRVARTRNPGRPRRAARTLFAVSVATPERCIRRLSRVRSTASTRRRSPESSRTTVPGRISDPSARREELWRPAIRASSWAAARPERTPRPWAVT